MNTSLPKSLIFLFVLLSVYWAEAQEVHKVSEAVTSSWKKEIEKLTTNHQEPIIGSSAAKPDANQQNQDPLQSLQQIVQDAQKADKDSKSAQLSKEAWKNRLEQFEAMKTQRSSVTQDAIEPSFAVKPDIKEISKQTPQSKVVVKDDDYLKVLKTQIHQRNIEQQKRIIENGLSGVKKGKAKSLQPVTKTSKSVDLLQEKASIKDKRQAASEEAQSKAFTGTRKVTSDYLTAEESFDKFKANYSTTQAPTVASHDVITQATRTTLSADSALASDSLALVDLYYALGGDFWYNNANWLTGNVSTWYGVNYGSTSIEVFDSLGNPYFKTVVFVTGLDLGSNNMSGVIPTTIGNLDSLEWINFNYNNITGGLPAEIGNLAKLTGLDLGGNFIDTLPVEIGNLVNLQNLALWNRTTDDNGSFITDGLTSVPAELWTLTNLYSLDLGGHNLSSISGIGNLTNLQFLYLWGNSLTTLPAEIGSLSMLWQIDVNNNQLSTLPVEIGSIDSLRNANFSSNLLTSLPTEIGNLAFLNNLDLSYNQLTTLPDAMGSLSQLEYLYIPQNYLTSIPTTFVDLDHLKEFRLWNNQITGSLSPFFGLDSLMILDLYSNQLTGTLDGISASPSLTEVYLGNNRLSGGIPSEISGLTNLTTFRVHDNQLDGTLAAELFELPNIGEIQLQNNMLTGTFPTTTGSNSIYQIELSNNRMTGLSASLGNFPNVGYIGLSNNQLEGSLPAEIAGDTSLNYLFVQNNYLTGTIPSEYQTLRYLQSIDLSGNSLDQSLPDDLFTGMESLNNFTISNNSIPGAIPSSIVNAFNLQYLWIDNNQFEDLPDMSSMFSLYEIHAAFNNFGFDDFEPLMQIYPYFDISPQNVPAPQKNIVSSGSKVTISVSVGGTAGKNHYAWYKDGNYLDVQDTSVLTISSLDLNTAGTYSCEVTNDSVTYNTGLSLNSGDRIYWISEPVATEDSLALVEIYHALKGDSWNNAGNWLRAPLVMWEGVFITNGRVTKLDLFNQNLQGGMPPAIGKLTALEWLALYNNQGLSYIPGELYGLTNLHYLDLDATGIDRISPSINLLTSLDTLWIGSNDYRTTIPKEIFDLTNLKVLEISGTGFKGQLPEEIGQLTNLEALWLNYNMRMSGAIPSSISNLTKLRYLNISNTPFSSGLDNVMSLTELRYLYVFYSPLVVDQMPSTLSNLTKLTNLGLGGADFSLAGIPSAIWSLSRLKYLSIRDCNVNSIVPPEISNLDSLTNIQIQNSGFIGSFPSDFNASSVSYLNLSGNSLDDISVFESDTTLNSFFATGNKLDFADLIPFAPYFETHEIYTDFDVSYMQPINDPYTYVQLKPGDSYDLTLLIATDSNTVVNWYYDNANSGGTPVATGAFFSLTSVTNPESDGTYDAYIQNSLITPYTDLQIWSGTTDIQVVESIATKDSTALLAIYSHFKDSTYIPDYVFDGWGTGPAENWNGVNAYGGYVYGLDLHGLYGTIPVEIGDLDSLQFLSLSDGSLSGTIPVEIFKPSLDFIDLGRNQLTGSIPTAVSNATNLTFLGLSNNMLSGSIPSEVGNCSFLTQLYLDNNRLTGDVPASLAGLSFNGLSLDRNWLSGLPQYLDTALMYTNYVNFEYNNFDINDLLNASGNNVNNDQTYAPQGTSRTLYFEGTGEIGTSVTLHAERIHPSDEFYWYRADKYNGQPYYYQMDYTSTDSTYTVQINGEDDQTSYMAVVVNQKYKYGSYPFLSQRVAVDPYQKRYVSSFESPAFQANDYGSDPNSMIGLPDNPPQTFDGDFGRSGLEWWRYQNWWHNANEPNYGKLTVHFDSPIPVNYLRLHSPGSELNIATMTLRSDAGDSLHLDVYRQIYNSDNQITFPKTSFAVSQVDLVVSNGSVDALEVGDTGKDVLDAPILTDQYTDIGDTYVNININYSGIGESIIIERSDDAVTFNVIDTIQYTGWYTDVVDPGKYYYRSKVIYPSVNMASNYSDTLATGNCMPTFPDGKIWAGESVGLDQYAGWTSKRDTVYIYPNESYASYQITDLSAGWYDQFWETYYEISGQFTQKCDKLVGYSYGQISEFNATYDQDTLYIEWWDYGNGIHVNSKFYAIGDAKTEEYKPEVPYNTQAFLTSSEKVTIGWDAYNPDGTVYVVQRSVGDATKFENVDTLIDVRTYQDINNLDGQYYYYRIVAANDVMASYPSSEVYLVHKAALFEPLQNSVTKDITRTSYGGSWGDYDADGDDDLYVANAFELANNFLYENTGNGTFKKIIGTKATTEAGFTRTAVWGDYNNDGFPDLYVPGSDFGDRVYQNTGSRSFVIAEQAVSDAKVTGLPSEGGIWVDIDNDGWLDLVKSTGFIFKNDGTGKLQLADTLTTPYGDLFDLNIYLWTISHADIDNDNDQDIYVTTDEQNILYINDGTGKFEFTENGICNDNVISRGYSWADFNNDGFIDLLTGDQNFDGLGIYLNDGSGDFNFYHISDIIDDEVGTDTRFGRGYTTADFDNNGWVDIIWMVEDRAYIILNEGNMHFTVVEPNEQAFPATNLYSHISLADFNQDGAMDIFFPNQDFNGHNFVYQSNGNSNSWITVKLKGIESNRSAIGAKVMVNANNQWQSHTLVTQNGIGSGNSLNAEFGLGSASVVDSIAVFWPSGMITGAKAVDVNQMFLMVEVPQSAGPTVDQNDSTALHKLYVQTGGPEWNRNQGWLKGSPLAWEGTEWDENGRLVSLILNSNNMTDTLPSEITTLSALEILDLSDNSLQGPVPPSIGDMTALVNLSLNNNGLTGKIPESIGSLTNLENLDLYNNEMFGEVPASVGNLQNLKQFEISNNQFIGYLPVEIGTLVNLQILRMDHNQFEGELPSGLGGMESLTVLHLNDNTFGGVIPSDFGDLSNLIDLRVHNNQFIGELPTTLANLTGIEVVDISNNMFEGSMAVFAELDTMYFLNANNNHFVDLGDLGGNTSDTILVQNNWLDFGDFETNNTLIADNRLFVDPQDSLYNRVDSLHDVGKLITISYPMGGQLNTYTWKFNGEPLVASSNVLIDAYGVDILSPDTPNEGEYVLEVTNENYPDITLVTRPFNLKLSSLERDKQALLAFIAAVDKDEVIIDGELKPNPYKYNPSGWSESNDLTGTTWEGVTVQNDRVVSLELPAVIDTDLTDGNQSRILDGNVPQSFADLSGIQTLNLKDNYLRSFVNISRWPSITTANISNNRLNFDAILPNVKLGTKITYSPQRRFGTTKYDTLKAGDDPVLAVEKQGLGVQYQWKFGAFIPGQPYNNDVTAIDGAISRLYQIEDLNYDKMGTYRVEATHPDVPGLTLSSRNQNIMAATDVFGTVYADDQGTLLTAGQVITFRKTPIGPFAAEDTVSLNPSGEYIFEKVVLGDFLVLTKPDRSVYPDTDPTNIVVDTYYEKADLYDNATTLEVRGVSSGVDINMVFFKPAANPPPTGADFEGELYSDLPNDTTIDEEHQQRILGRKKVKRAACSMRRFVGSGRVNQGDQYELYAYIESDDDGKFNFSNVEPGTYKLNIQYPGVPMDPDADIDFVIGGDKENQLFQLTAVITEDGIQVKSEEILFTWKPFIKDVKLYPNPTKGKLKADFLVYRKLEDLKLEVYDIRGIKLKDQQLSSRMGPQSTEVDLTNVDAGVYFIIFTDSAGSFRHQLKVNKE